jgi:DNA invertase Pin-like site-specific DNA recombinase
MRIVVYKRVSTQKQGASGLGLEAQEETIRRYIDTTSAQVMGEFTEVESGRNGDRPQLDKALHRAKVTGSTLVVATIDRVTRNASFWFKLRDSGQKVIAAEMPEAGEFLAGILAVVAEYEGKRISERTKAALASAKARGVRLGNPHGLEVLQSAGKGTAAALAAIKTNADHHAANISPIIDELQAEGISSLEALASALNERGILTRRGGRWHKSTVRDLLIRLGVRK